jgi:hypothetical protein
MCPWEDTVQGLTGGWVGARIEMGTADKQKYLPLSII